MTTCCHLSHTMPSSSLTGWCDWGRFKCLKTVSFIYLLIYFLFASLFSLFLKKIYEISSELKLLITFLLFLGGKIQRDITKVENVTFDMMLYFLLDPISLLRWTSFLVSSHVKQEKREESRWWVESGNQECISYLWTKQNGLSSVTLSSSLRTNLCSSHWDPQDFWGANWI